VDSVAVTESGGLCGVVWLWSLTPHCHFQ